MEFLVGGGYKMFLQFVNTKLGRYLFGIKENYPVAKITPNSIHYLVGKDTYKAVIGGKNPVGSLLHLWDKFANRFFPKLNVGFDTFNPSTGAGFRDYDDATWSTAHDATSASLQYGRVCLQGTGYYYLGRGFFPFDTSNLPNGATITAVTFSFWPDDLHGDTDSFVIVQSSQASNTTLADDDFDTLGTTSGGSIIVSSVTAGQYNDITLNATGRSWVSLTGYTKLGMRMLQDINNGTPTTRQDVYPNMTTHPVILTVTYTTGGGTVGWRNLLGVGR